MRWTQWALAGGWALLRQGETEAALAARWRAGEFVGRWLRAASGERVMVVFPGRPGGPAGPDFRDAVLARPDGARLYGDVEVHLRARGWRAHGHDRDPRYAGVVLHVVLRAEGARATPLASGTWAALVELAAMPPVPPVPPPPRLRPAGPTSWPCADLARRLEPAAVRSLLHNAGDARFEQRAQEFMARLAEAESGAACARCRSARGRTATHTGDIAACEPESLCHGRGGWGGMDRVLFAALAEGLAYGREREPLRRAGEWLAGGGAPDALLRELPLLPALDAVRLEGLLTLFARWVASGPWAPLRATLDGVGAVLAGRRLVAALVVPGGSVSPGRAAILAANVALPCAAAWAVRHGDPGLLARARAAYAALPGLPSNQITREMVRQLGLSHQPSGARAQQGLHHLWAHHCREKRCAQCPCAVETLPLSVKLTSSAQRLPTPASESR